MEKWEEDILEILKAGAEKSKQSFNYSAIDEAAESAQLTREEFIKVAQQLELGQGEVTVEGLSIVLDWIRQTKIDEALLKLTLLRGLSITIKNGEVAFKKEVDI